MQLDAMGSAADVQAALRRAAEETWGAERAAALQAQLEATAGALWQLAEQPLDFFDIEPDFISAPEA